MQPFRKIAPSKSAGDVRTCDGCHGQFTAARPNQTTCNRECYEAKKKVRHRELVRRLYAESRAAR